MEEKRVTFEESVTPEQIVEANQNYSPKFSVIMMNKAAMGEFFEMKSKNITVYHELSNVEIIETIE